MIQTTASDGERRLPRLVRIASPSSADAHRASFRRVGSERWAMDELTSQVTRLLGEMPERPQAASDLLPLVYHQLRAIAQRRMAGERRDHTLQATALVHEVYARLVADPERAWESRAHFYRVAAEAMRRLLIDHARKHNAGKRGGGARSVPLSVVDLAESHDPAQVLAIDEAIRTLEAEDARAAEIVRMRFFAGLSVEETALALGLSERSVLREWSYARTRLFQLLSPAEPR